MARRFSFSMSSLRVDPRGPLAYLLEHQEQPLLIHSRWFYGHSLDMEMIRCLSLGTAC